MPAFSKKRCYTVITKGKGEKTMKNNIRIPVVLLIAVLCLSMSACCMKHTFSASTCAAPGVCSKCGKTSDEPLADHT